MSYRSRRLASLMTDDYCKAYGVQLEASARPGSGPPIRKSCPPPRIAASGDMPENRHELGGSERRLAGTGMQAGPLRNLPAMAQAHVVRRASKNAHPSERPIAQRIQPLETHLGVERRPGIVVGLVALAASLGPPRQARRRGTSDVAMTLR
jgi:hypothetical protein